MAYFDNAATTYPKPEIVYEYMDRVNRSAAGNPGRGTHILTRSAGQLVDETRVYIQKLLHCTAKEVVFQPTATQALNVILFGVIQDGAKKVYVSPFEHNAVMRVLYHLEDRGMISVNLLPVSQCLQYDTEEIQRLWKVNPPDMVVISHASNVIGLITPVEEIFRIAKGFGAVTVLDMSQTAGLVDINVGSEHIDFAVFAGHKTLLGPTGVSGFVMTPRLKNIEPLVYGGTGIASADPLMPDEAPIRFEAGTANVVGVAGLNAALKWILSKTVPVLRAADQANRDRLIQLLERYDYVNIIGIRPGHDYVGIVSCTIDGMPSDTGADVFEERGIYVRGGLHCAPSAHRFLGTYPTGTVRFSVSPLTTDQDFEELERALSEIGEEF